MSDYGVCFCVGRGRVLHGPTCPECGGAGYVPASDGDALRAEVTRLTEALRFLCRADTDVCDFCGATATKRSPEAERWGAWWCDACAPPDAVDHEHAATLRPLLPPRGAK